ncbi:MAG: transposase [Pseudomonadota bacterium]
MLLAGDCFGIRSERRPCEEEHLSLAGHWFYLFGLSDPIPDHSTLAKNHHVRF